MSNGNNTILTEEGRKKVEEELERLKTIIRKELSEKIRVAKDMGDISENAEYSSAKEEQGLAEARISELEKLLSSAEVISSNGVHSTDMVTVGSVVTVFDNKKKEEKVYTIVGFSESNPAQGKISNESPLGQALVGHKVGEKISLEIPNGVKDLTIKKII